MLQCPLLAEIPHINEPDPVKAAQGAAAYFDVELLRALFAKTASSPASA
jgi:hypothetical protein